MSELIKYLELKMCLNFTVLALAISTFGLVLGSHTYSEIGGVLGVIMFGGSIGAFLMFAGLTLVALYQIHVFKSRERKKKGGAEGS